MHKFIRRISSNCIRNSTGQTVDNSFCPVDADASISTLSPAGTKNITFTNGSRDVTCPSGSFISDGLGYGWGVVNNDTFTSQFKGFQVQVNPGFSQVSVTYAAVRNDNEFCWLSVGSKNLNDLYIFNDNYPYFAVADVVSLVGQYLFNQTLTNQSTYLQGLSTTSSIQTYSGSFSNMQNLNMARPTAACQQRFQKVMYK